MMESSSPPELLNPTRSHGGEVFGGLFGGQPGIRRGGGGFTGE